MGKKFLLFRVFLAVAAATAVAGFMIFSGGQFTAQRTHAGSGDALSGYAWSENIGWISFNCTIDPNGCGSSNYGVNIDANENFSGYAWSENIGWISFNRSDTGTPPGTYDPAGPSYIAKFDPATNTVQGWARAIAANSPTSPGWDGWIRLQSASGENPSYGVSYNIGSRQFQGWAWGGDVVGWISFNCSDTGSCSSSNYYVRGTMNTAPTVSNPIVLPGSYCGAPAQPLAWQFSDAQDGIIQTAYQLQVSNNSNFTNIVFDSDNEPGPKTSAGHLATSSMSSFVPVSASPQTNQLSFNKTYYWRVQAFDSGGLSSGWVTGPSFDTSKHPYPQPSFTWSPASPSIGQTIIFTDQTVFAPGSQNDAWSWAIPNATYMDGTSSTNQNPHVKFASQQSVSVTLTSTDDVGSCAYAHTIIIKPPLPQFKEVQPQ